MFMSRSKSWIWHCRYRGKPNRNAFMISSLCTNSNRSSFIKTMFRILLLGMVVTFSRSVSAQEQTPKVMPDVPVACEQNAVYLEDFNVQRNIGMDRAFVIVRAGDGEGSAELKRRFTIVTKYLKKFFAASDDEFTFARGEKVAGQGRVEMYLGGKLLLVMLAKKGRIPCMNCCGYDFQRGRF